MNKGYYKIFSLIFHAPDRNFIAYLRNGFVEDINAMDSASLNGFALFFDENREKNDEEFYTTLAVEHTRLFTNAIPKVPCPPYESIYRENVIMGNSTLDVLECYHKTGLKIAEKFRDLPDHVAVELEFLYFLANYGYDELHDSFMKDHFSKWVPIFCEEVEKNDRIGFYRHAARALKEFVNKEGWNKAIEVSK